MENTTNTTTTTESKVTCKLTELGMALAKKTTEERIEKLNQDLEDKKAGKVVNKRIEDYIIDREGKTVLTLPWDKWEKQEFKKSWKFTQYEIEKLIRVAKMQLNMLALKSAN